ncbi:MAG: hypothetical protein UV82_C0004G0016 [Candidatus Magasanikbacteria bacterium GW2011_GWD2_43_18]|nr:MAG: hypothetical protein UV18_C0001G0098 [Candidatus Magasanikbacteria bacterium GW2011_GWC2_42_27]KKT04851.1 MAG: hypothetical protein UV82_C0004G0016 [Candidatus Magasanikbacteria bacterium GW2011_GWD2_43_18]KKT23733.1 MAG: hypothetical protein UW10_C0032G0003 [Candidatus Magasanikbacteria bacterium GW2011_GWA2_43_9]HBB37533.1 hypothetical protein [Candidatus Magasanikbacteria bacterium]HCC13786.1 hypothetical protein [Candidatus Magasanikbacteria bacterium]
MTLQEQLQADMIAAMKAKDTERVRVLRNAIAALKNTKIEKGETFSEVDAEATLKTQVKQLKDANKDFAAGGRDDLVAQNDADVAVLETYLPEQMSDEDLGNIVADTLRDIGATSPQDMGKAMGAVMEKVNGKADGTRVKDAVMKYLQ